MKKYKISKICILVLSTVLFTNSYVYACAPGEVYKKVPSSYYDDYYTTPNRIMATNSKTDEYVILNRGPSYKAFSIHGKHNIITYSVTGNKKVVTDKYGNNLKEYKLNLQELSNALAETVRKTGDKSFTLDVPNLPKPTEEPKSNIKESPKAKVQVKHKEESKPKVEQVAKPKEEYKPEVKKETPKEEPKQEVKEVVESKEEINKEPEPTSTKETKLEATKTSNQNKNSSLLLKLGSIVALGGIVVFSGITIARRLKLRKK